MRLFITILLLILTTVEIKSQDSLGSGTDYNKGRVTALIASEAVLYTGTMIALNEFWYKDYPRSSFHHFNDNSQWLQMDKVGHAWTAYYVGLMGMDAARWAGLNEQKSRWYGGGLGWMFLTSVEVLDGFSEEWGFSSGDMIANTLGMGILIGQDMLWDEQRVVFKYSFKQSPYAKLRPATLGEGWQEELLKDYNGQSYWLSANIHSFMPEESKFPKWLSLGVGYGVDGVIASSSDFVILNAQSSLYYPQQREFYLGPDIDLWRIRTKHKGLKTVFKALGFIKFPLPALKFQDGNFEVQGFSF